MNIFDFTDDELSAFALDMWANYLETGNTNLSASDAVNCGKRELIRVLNFDQVKFTIRLRERAMILRKLK